MSDTTRRGRKRICVIGLGSFGSELARRLARQCDVLAIDIDPTRTNLIADHVQQAVQLDVRDAPSLRGIVSRDFDEAIVSVGESIETSVLATLHLKKIGVPMIRAKALTDDHAQILQAVGADQVIFPERETARRLAVQIRNPNLLDFIPLERDYRVIELAPPESFSGKSLQELKLRNRYDVLVVAIKQLVPEGFVFLPRSDYLIKPSDILIIIGREEDVIRIKDEAPGEEES